jgi:hypothetical protein
MVRRRLLSEDVPGESAASSTGESADASAPATPAADESASPAEATDNSEITFGRR